MKRIAQGPVLEHELSRASLLGCNSVPGSYNAVPVGSRYAQMAVNNPLHLLSSEGRAKGSGQCRQPK